MKTPVRFSDRLVSIRAIQFHLSTILDRGVENINPAGIANSSGCEDKGIQQLQHSPFY